MEHLSGKVLGQYKIVETLGVGGMASVYKAYQPGPNRYVALKVLSPRNYRDPSFQDRFRQEVALIANFQHPHILPIFDFGEEDGYAFVAMPYIKSGTLANMVEDSPISLAKSSRIINQVSEALDYAHSQGVIHRDIKPDNILIDQSGNALLADFGIAKIIGDTVEFTGSDKIVGTPNYMSPEQINDQSLDGRSDIYSLGVVLYEMVTGQTPFRGDTPISLAVKHLLEPIPPPRSVQPDIPPAVEHVIMKALEKTPDKRYETAGLLADDLQKAILADEATNYVPLPLPIEAEPHPDLPQTAETRVLTKTVKRQGFRARVPQLAAAAAILLIFALLSWLFVNNYRTTQTATQPDSSPVTQPTVASALDQNVGDEDATVLPVQQVEDNRSPLTVFNSSKLGIALFTNQDQSEAQEVVEQAEAQLAAVLAGSGISSEVQSAVISRSSDKPIDVESKSINADIGLLVKSNQHNDEFAIIIEHYVEDPLRKDEDEENSFFRIADTLFEPFTAGSLDNASRRLANRLGALANALLGYEALNEGDHAECARRFSAVLRLGQNLDVTYAPSEVAHAVLAICQAALGQNEQAKENFEAAIQIYPDYAVAYHGLGNYHYLKNDLDLAQEFFQKTIEKAYIDPLANEETLGLAYNGLGNIAMARGDFDAALLAFDRSIAMEPDFPAYYLSRGLAKNITGTLNPDADFRECITLATSKAKQSEYYRQLESDCRRELAHLEQTDATRVAATETREKITLRVRPEFTSVSVREGPHQDNFPTLAYLYAGDETDAIGRTSSGDWFLIRLADDKTGWIASSVVEMVEHSETGSVPVAMTIPAAPPATITPTAEATVTPTLWPTVSGGGGDNSHDRLPTTQSGGQYPPTAKP